MTFVFYLTSQLKKEHNGYPWFENYGIWNQSVTKINRNGIFKLGTI
ncbi:hypothetical protein SGADD02_02263 [Streptococcus gallolyticus]|uniref:Uncharacterized protein n=1 Tax=Streptococcus gallolyticus TaxID=315405 RepID=A0A139MFV0_9STRE|nr:hypothetical protein SGADD02_02263 [Streptococcus gallolyticus]